MTNTLDNRDNVRGLDIRVANSLAHRTEIMNGDQGTGVSVQELINAVCDLLDGTQDHHIVDMIGDEETADRLAEIRNQLRPLWTTSEGSFVISRG